MELELGKPVSLGMIDWFCIIATSLISLDPELEVEVGEGGPGLLPLMLVLATAKAPKLQHLQIMGRWMPCRATIESLASLGQIKELTLEGWTLPASGRLNEICSLSGV
jgi:hypothetical protein